MKLKWLAVGFVALLCSTGSSAQTTMSGAGTCAKPDVDHSIQVPDSPGQSFSISQAKCTWSKPWQIEGQATTGGVATAFAHTRGNSARESEVYVDTFANGEKVFYSYDQTVSLKNNVQQPTKGKWTITSATGKWRGIKGNGTCSVNPQADGSAKFECQGEYTMPAAKPAK